MSGFSIDWAAHAEALASANRRNKEIVFEALGNAEVKQVRVAFDGEGDQGQMERAIARNNRMEITFPEAIVTILNVEWGATAPSVREMNLQDAVEHLCYAYLEQDHGGWENNEGSFGEFVLEVEAKTVTLDFYGRLTETIHSTHRF